MDKFYNKLFYMNYVGCKGRLYGQKMDKEKFYMNYVGCKVPSL
mgnify:CR=1 FL=1